MTPSIVCFHDRAFWKQGARFAFSLQEDVP